jgi:hypothetical protein
MAEVAAEHREPFEELESVAELLAFSHKRYGEVVFRELLTRLASGAAPAQPWLLSSEELNHVTTREAVETWAHDLASHGLRKLAKITREHAATRPRQVELCPYAPGTAGARAWLFQERQNAGLCPWCASDSPETICDNGESCLARWRTHLARTPRPT